MGEEKETARDEGTDGATREIDDPRAGMDRLRAAVRGILKVPKSAIEDSGDDSGE